MFCYQCEQTAGGNACTTIGVCGKDQETAILQDLLVYALQGISMYAHRARKNGLVDREIDTFVVKGLFTTVTNVNFDPARLQKLLLKADKLIQQSHKLYHESIKSHHAQEEHLTGPAQWKIPLLAHTSLNELIHEGMRVSITSKKTKFGEAVTGLLELILYGLKGMAAYADHASILGQEDDAVYAFFHEALDFMTKDGFTTDELVAMAMRVGEMNLRVMELLDGANTGAYGHPVPTKVRVNPIKGKAIVVSGHDLKDLEELLKQTEGMGINIYTHGEMLPAHGYPGLKRYSHLAGNYGGAWQDQQAEFDDFPGAILMTTNCIQKPMENYKKKIFTSGLVAWPGVGHIMNHDFKPLIEAALADKGFKSDGPDQEITVGFGRNAVIGVADKVIDAVKAGKIKHFFLIGGCDGAKSGRNYYTDFATKAPKDTVILTLACGKFRFNKLEFGDIGGIPRLLDAGQCNDAYSAIKIALTLADAFKVGVNELPLSLILSWYEQKAVAILLTLLFLGIKNIRMGPTMPAFIHPSVYEFLQKNFNLMPIKTAEEDLKAILG